MTIVDTHVHIISSDPERFPYAPQAANPPDWPVERLMVNMECAGVDRAVLVQYSTVHGYDNSYVLDAARRYPEHFVAVVTLDGLADDAPQRLTQCVEGGAAGLRLRAPTRNAPLDWLTCDPLWQKAVELDIPICVHFGVHDHEAGLLALGALLRRLPTARVLLDHVGNPPWSEGPPDYGLRHLIDLASQRGLYVKFATINLDRLNAAGVSPQPALQRLVQVFGAQRVMWGSDAPNTPGHYALMLARTREALSEISAANRKWILGGTALCVYRNLRS